MLLRWRDIVLAILCLEIIHYAKIIKTLYVKGRIDNDQQFRVSLPRAKSQEPRAKSQEPNSALKILVCYHKSYTMPPLDDGILLPIQVGKSLTDIDLHIQSDNEVNGQPCDNISDKNASYNEMTALYWAWKNLKKLYPNVKYVGLFHYRRFLAFDKKNFFTEEIKMNESEIKSYKLYTQKIMNIIDGGKIIITKPVVFPYSVLLNYEHCLHSWDYRILKEIIANDFPDYYEDFIDFMENNNKLSARNMFIMKYDDFVEYCEWIFAVLNIFERSIHMEYYDAYQKRTPAFMAERLFNVWLRKNKKKFKFYNVYHYDENFRHQPFKECIFFLRDMIDYLKAGITAALLRESFRKGIKKILKSIHKN